MEKDKRKEIKPEPELELEVAAVEETPQGVTVGLGVYKPIPRFRGGCSNC